MNGYTVLRQLRLRWRFTVPSLLVGTLGFGFYQAFLLSAPDLLHRSHRVGRQLTQGREQGSAADCPEIKNSTEPLPPEMEPSPYRSTPQILPDGSLFDYRSCCEPGPFRTLSLMASKPGSALRQWKVSAPSGWEFLPIPETYGRPIVWSPRRDHIAWLCMRRPAALPLPGWLRGVFPSSFLASRPELGIWISRFDGKGMRFLGGIEESVEALRNRPPLITHLHWLSTGRGLDYTLGGFRYRIDLNNTDLDTRHDFKPPALPTVPYPDVAADAVDLNAPGRHVAPLLDPSRAAELLEGTTRDRRQQPAQIVKMLRLRPGECVADIGAGSGYLLPYLSHAVGPHGGVFAEEIQTDYLPALRRRATLLKNVQVVFGTEDDPRLRQSSADCVMMLTVYHEVRHPVVLLRVLHDIVRGGGRLAIVDFDRSRKGFPPEVEDHQVSEADVLREARSAGWKLAERHDFLAGQFFLVFNRS